MEKLLNKIISIESGNILNLRTSVIQALFSSYLKCVLGIIKDSITKKEREVDTITDWMSKNGAVIDGVEIGEFDGYGFGLKAAKDIKEGDLLICVPRKLMLTTEFARTSELGEKIW